MAIVQHITVRTTTALTIAITVIVSRKGAIVPIVKEGIINALKEVISVAATDNSVRVAIVANRATIVGVMDMASSVPTVSVQQATTRMPNIA